MISGMSGAISESLKETTFNGAPISPSWDCSSAARLSSSTRASFSALAACWFLLTMSVICAVSACRAIWLVLKSPTRAAKSDVIERMLASLPGTVRHQAGAAAAAKVRRCVWSRSASTDLSRRSSSANAAGAATFALAASH